MLDFSIDGLFDDFLDTLYMNIMDFLTEVFSLINNMGVEIFELPWIEGILFFFSKLGLALFITGFIVAVFETAIEYQNGRNSIRDLLLNTLKGFMAVNLFFNIPIELYKFAISLQSSLSFGITESFVTEGISGLGIMALGFVGGVVFPSGAVASSLFIIIFCILIGYAVLKVFFDNLKRGGILLTMISVGSLYMFSIPRGYTDGFSAWAKQIVGICLTAFMQTLILLAGLLTINDEFLLGIGLMLSATEVPRVAGSFGLDTSTKTNMMASVYTAQSAINLTKTIQSSVSKTGTV